MSQIWNPIHGCTKVSPGCQNCYMFRRDHKYGIDSTIVRKTKAFDLPLRCDRQHNYKLKPSGGTVLTCFTSDFFHEAADDWRPELWEIIASRPDLHFYMITKRPERIDASLPDTGCPDNVTICCTCENQKYADLRLPVFLSLPLPHKEIIFEPMLEEINIEKYLAQYHNDIEMVSVGGESGDGPGIRTFNYGWVITTKMQCTIYKVPFRFHQTGTYFQIGKKVYTIPREEQESQAKKSGQNWTPETTQKGIQC